MISKFMEYMKLAGDKISGISISHRAMIYIIIYAAVVAGGCGLYMFAWCVDWNTIGKPDLQEFRLFLHEIASTPWIAMIGFICKALVDKDGDGIPDEFEDKEVSNDEFSK